MHGQWICANTHAHMCLRIRMLYMYTKLQTFLHISDPGSRFATSPAHPLRAWPQNLRFAVFRHKNVVFAVFFAWWVAGAVCKTSNSRDFCNHTLWSRQLGGVLGHHKTLSATCLLSCFSGVTWLIDSLRYQAVGFLLKQPSSAHLHLIRLRSRSA